MKKWLWPPQGWTWRPLHPNPSYSASFSTPQQECSPKAGAFQWPLSVAFFSDHVFLSSEFCLECPPGFSPPSDKVTLSAEPSWFPPSPQGAAELQSDTAVYLSSPGTFPPCQGEFFCPKLFSQQMRASCYTPENSEKAISQQPAGEPRQKELSPWHRTTLPKRHGGSRNWGQTLRGWCLCLARQLHWFLFLKVWQNFRNDFGINKNCLVCRVFQTHKVEQPWLSALCRWQIDDR